MLIFLDIDGVMVPAKGYKQPEFLQDGFAAFSSQAARALDRLVAEYAPTIMLTTSHKSNYSIEEWKRLFEKRGVYIEKIKSLPENDGYFSRKEEIVNWFNSNEIDEDFIIIDDDKSLNSLSNYLKDHLILTSSFIGLTEEHLDDIKKVLRKDVSY